MSAPLRPPESALLIVGMGATTGYGHGVDVLHDGMSSGKSCARIERVDGVDRLIGLVDTADDGHTSRLRQAISLAVEEAIADATGRGWQKPDDLAIVFAGGSGELERQKAAFLSGRKLRARQFVALPPSSIPASLAIEFDVHGPAMMIAAACASANVALDLASLWMDAGRAHDVLVLNAEVCVAREHLDGFKALRVMFDEGDALEICQPFSEASSGFFVGEAACAFIVTNRPVVDRRAELVATATNMDGFHPTAMAPDGNRYRTVLEDVMIGPDPVVAVNAHGTGTRLNDRVERSVLDASLPEGCLVYSTKPLTGHCLSASAGVELIATVLGATTGTLTACSANDSDWARMADGPTAVGPGLHVNIGVGLGGFNSAAAIRP